MTFAATVICSTIPIISLGGLVAAVRGEDAKRYRYDELGNRAKDNYDGKITVTIVVEQPVPDSRQAIALPSYDVGHTFIRLDMENGDALYSGFWPENGLETKDILKQKNVSGELRDDNEHGWNIAKTYIISEEQRDITISFIEEYDKEYNMVQNNCTTFAVEALTAAGIEPPSSPVKWTLPDNALEEALTQIPLYIPFRKSLISNLFNKLFGYSPGDAGEDIRKSNQFILRCDIA